MKKLSAAACLAAVLLLCGFAYPSAPIPWLEQITPARHQQPASSARLSKLNIKASEAARFEPLFLYQTSLFQVNAQMPVLKCSTLSLAHRPLILQVKLTDAESGALVQRLDFVHHDHYDFMQSAAYFMDVTFDGSLDLLIPREHSARYISFDAFLWDAGSRQFVYEPSFETVYNPTPDPAQKRLYCRTSGAQTTCFTIIAFESNEFTAPHSLVWWPRYLDSDAEDEVPENLLHCREYRYDTVIKDFYVLQDEVATDPRTKDYFASGSLWDLHNPRWRSTLLDELRDY